jgi:signal transduction histidine kinase
LSKSYAGKPDPDATNWLRSQITALSLDHTHTIFVRMEPEKAEHTAIDSLYRISSLISDTEDPKIALQYILDEIVRVLQPSSASISLIKPDTKKLELEVSHGLPNSWQENELAVGQGITGWTALHGRPLIVPDVSKEPRYIAFRSNIHSEMAVPMEDHGTTIGVVNVDSETLDFFDQQSLKILTLLTNEATRVITKLWLIQQTRTKANQLESLVQLGRRIAGELDPEHIYQSIAKEARILLDSHVCALCLHRPDDPELDVHIMIGRDGPLDNGGSINRYESTIGIALQRRKIVEINNLPYTEESQFQKIIRREGLVSMLAAPILFNDQAIGVLCAFTDKLHRFSNDEKKVFSTLSSLGAISINNARLYNRVFTTEESLRRNEKLTTLGMLSAEIAHEIRNPLTVIKLLFDSLGLDFPSEDPRKTDLVVISEKINQLEEIVERVLRFGRNRESMNTRCDLNDLIADTLRLVRLKLQQQKIAIHFQPQAEGLRIEVNKGQIQQVMLNLILNATHAIEGAGSIFIETATEEEQAQFIIRDTGHGIPPDKQSEIFDSFLTHRPEGTGLGLAISKRILRAHRGNIELDHSSPEGTTFRFWLPQSKL